MLKEILDIVDMLDGADASGASVVHWLHQRGAEAEVVSIDAGGHTDLVSVRLAGTDGRTAGGTAPTLGVIGRLGGVGSRPNRLGLVSDADGAIVALAAAGVLARMRARGDRLRGDVLVRTHVSPASPMIPHEPAPFIDVPVDRDVLARAELDPGMDAILSIDSTRANRIAKRSGFGITGTVKEGYLLRPTPAMLDICERVGRRPAVVVPVFTQDLTPPGNGIHHINSILQPATMTDAPVIGIALLSPMIVGGASTGVVHEQDLATAGRLVVEIAKEYCSGALALYHDEEFRRLVELYGPMKHLQEPSAAARQR